MEGVLCNFEIVEPLVSEAQGLNGFPGHSAKKSLLPKRIGYSNAKFAGFVIETRCAPENLKMHPKRDHFSTIFFTFSLSRLYGNVQ